MIKAICFICVTMFTLLSVTAMADNLDVLPDTINGVTPDNMMVQYLYDESEPFYRQWETDFAARLNQTPAQIQAYNQQMRDKIEEVMGGFPEEYSLNAQIVGDTLYGDGFKVEKVIFESRPNHRITGLMWLPDSAEFTPPYPAVVLGCGHIYNNTKAWHQYQKICRLAAINGMAAFSFDPMGQSERFMTADISQEPWAPSHDCIGSNSSLVGREAAGYLAWDCMRSVDYVQSRSDVNSALIGFMGHSGGGNQTALAMALDDSVVAAAPCVGYSCYEYTEDLPLYMDAEQQIFGTLTFGFDQYNYWQMRAPDVKIRNVTGELDAWSVEGLRLGRTYAQQLFSKFDPSYTERIELFEEAGSGHDYNQTKREASIQWLKRWLVGVNETIVEPAWTEFDEDLLWCTDVDGVMAAFPGEKSIYDFNIEYENDVLAPQRQQLWATTPQNDLLDMVREKAVVRKLSDMPNPDVEYVGVIQRSGYRIEKVIIKPEDGIFLPALMFVPEDTPIKGAVLYVDQKGKRNTAEPCGRLEELTKEGYAVLSVDLRGIGETVSIPSARVNMYILNYFSAYRIGKTYLGMRSEDILACANWLAQNTTVGAPGQVKLLSVGNVSISALHAAALESQLFEDVQLEGVISSFSDDILKNPGNQDNRMYLAHGVLEVYDLPDLVNLLGDKIKIGADEKGLMHRWSFNGGYEDSVGGADATLRGTAALASIDSRQCLDLTANANDKDLVNNGWAELPISTTIASLTDECTVEMWMKDSDNRTAVSPFGIGGSGWALNILCNYYYTATYFEPFFGVNSGYTYILSPTRPAPDTWVHFVMTIDKDGDTMNAYVNGSPAGSTTCGGAPVDFDVCSSAYLGRFIADSFNFWAGAIDEFRIHGKALTAAEVLDSYNAGPDAVICCEDVVNGDWGTDADVDEDCYVTMTDFAQVADEWGYCYDPEDPTCTKHWQASVIDATNLIHRWSFNGDYTDSVGSADAAPGGAAKITCNALDLTSNTGSISDQLDPAAAWAQLPIGDTGQTLSTLTDKCTIEVWMIQEEGNNTEVLFDFGRGWVNDSLKLYSYQYLSEPNYIDPFFCVNGVYRYMLVPHPILGDYNHIVITTDKTNQLMKFYVNGQFVSSTSCEYAPADFTFPVDAYLGRHSGANINNYNLWKGRIDEFRIYDTALSDSEIEASYNLGPDARSSCATCQTCQGVLDANLGLSADVHKDCRIDMLDLACLASDWLRCFEPSDTNCETPWE